MRSWGGACVRHVSGPPGIADLYNRRLPCYHSPKISRFQLSSGISACSVGWLCPRPRLSVNILYNGNPALRRSSLYYIRLEASSTSLRPERLSADTDTDLERLPTPPLQVEC
ncbi:hypothetical protein CY34DRAFT_601639 [Suillus luteus UH-Slu-Lm8-n1]|uniref:Uncharacterized protein n=1 Tax=Suillus luteus UH-Slu-Lm8-n1 TaxID=930992 RepID=A0A0C9ZZY2_9AGAM|nr:hypothetical protein CY34DRAFT_601639 [Suillus luteus UH-Slu-Lm8-n1]